MIRLRERLIIELNSQSNLSSVLLKHYMNCLGFVLFPIHRTRAVYEHQSIFWAQTLSWQLEDLEEQFTDFDKRCTGLKSRTVPLTTNLSRKISLLQLQLKNILLVANVRASFLSQINLRTFMRSTITSTKTALLYFWWWIFSDSVQNENEMTNHPVSGSDWLVVSDQSSYLSLWLVWYWPTLYLL